MRCQEVLWICGANLSRPEERLKYGVLPIRKVSGKRAFFPEERTPKYGIFPKYMGRDWIIKQKA
jgi:hypothetical protein